MTSGAVRVLVTGAGGQVGRALMEGPTVAAIDLLGLDRTALDITGAAAVTGCLSRLRPDIVVNCAAYTAVDRAEVEPAAADAANADGARHMAAACAAAGVPLIHLSTDYVFDGGKNGAYAEADAPAPINAYGRSKLAGERAVAALADRHIILRTSWVYGPHGGNFVRAMLDLAKTREIVRVVDDQIGCPTAADHIAEVIRTLVERIAGGGPVQWGLYHYCDDQVLSWCGFAGRIFDLARAHGLCPPHLAPIAAADYPTPGRRPANSVLDCRRIADVFGIAPASLDQGLSRCVDALLNPALA